MPTRLNSSENPDPSIAVDFLEEEHHDRNRRDVGRDPKEVKIKIKIKISINYFFR